MAARSATHTVSEILKVAIDATPLLGPRTGIGVATEAILKRLASDDSLEMTGFVVSFRGRHALPGVLPAGVRNLALPYPARLARTLWKYADWPGLGDFDLVHGTNFVVPPSTAGASLVTINDLTPWNYPELATRDTKRYPQLVERARQRGAHVHAISHFVANEVVDKLNFLPDRVHAIPLGYEPGPFGEPSTGKAAAGFERYVIAIGTIEPRKDYPALLSALAQLRRLSHPDLGLVVVGSPGWGVEAFDAQLTQLDLGGAVLRTGYVTAQRKADLLAGAECLAYPSLYEGFGLPPLEAMAAGIPVVATAAGAIPEVVGDAALVVEVGSTEALADGIARLLDDPKLAGELVSKGYERVELFQWDETARRISDLYKSLLWSDQ